MTWISTFGFGAGVSEGVEVPGASDGATGRRSEWRVGGREVGGAADDG